MKRLALRLTLGLFLLPLGCGGEDETAERGARLEQGLRDRYGETDVGILKVSMKKPPTADVILVDLTAAKRTATRVTLAVGEKAIVGRRRFVLVGVGGDEGNRYVDFRLEPAKGSVTEQAPTTK